MFHLNDSLNIWSCCAGVSCEFCETSKSTFSYKPNPVASSVLCVYLFWYCEQVILHRQKQHQRCYIKKDTRRNFAKFSGKHLCQGLFLNKIADFRPATLLKRDSGTGVFLWILSNFYEHLFPRTPLDDCFLTG